MRYWWFISFGPPLETNTVEKSEHDEDEEGTKTFWIQEKNWLWNMNGIEIIHLFVN